MHQWTDFARLKMASAHALTSLATLSLASAMGAPAWIGPVLYEAQSLHRGKGGVVSNAFSAISKAWSNYQDGYSKTWSPSDAEGIKDTSVITDLCNGMTYLDERIHPSTSVSEK